MNPFMTIQEIRDLLSRKETSPQDIISFYQKRLQTYNKKLNAALEIFDDVSASNNEGNDKALSGIPGILKDLICQKNRITSCASRMLANYRAPYDATVTRRLKAAGAPILGRSNMDEFAMGSTGEYSAFGPTKNPWDLSRSPGGSSSGSAAAVAAGLVPWALGSETGGSVRQPAAFCNLVGMYPTYGLVSRRGLIAFTSSTDQIGPLTRTVYDNAYLMSIIAGHDPQDSTSISKPQRNFTKNLTDNIPQNLTIGIIDESLESEGVDPEIKAAFEQAIKHLETLGVRTKLVTLPNLKYGIATYFTISRAEASSNLARFDGSLFGIRNQSAKSLFDMYIKTRHDGFGDEVKRRILMGTYVLSAQNRGYFYQKASDVRTSIRAEFNHVFNDVDLLVSPTTSALPFTLKSTNNNPLAAYMNDYFTVPMCLAGIPALALPCGLSKNKLPISFQFIGPRLSEELLYQVAHAFEQTTQYHTNVPAGFDS